MTGGLTELRAIMQHFRRFLPNDLPLRPLLFAAGAAATAAGVYIVRKKKKRDDQERTVHTSVSQGTPSLSLSPPPSYSLYSLIHFHTNRI